MKKFWLGFATVITGGLTVYGVKEFLAGTVTEETRIGYILAPFLFALSLWGLIRSVRRKAEAPKPEKAEPKAPVTATRPAASVPDPEPRPAAKKAKQIYHGKVVGVTYKGRPGVLARLKKKADDCEQLYFELQRDEYEGEPSIKVMASVMGEDDTEKQIGFIAKEDVAGLLPYVDNCSVTGEVYGGPEYEGEEDPKNYGCAIDVYVTEE